MTLKEEDCWQAVLSRDTSLNGVFVYAVRSTGVYCRPGCAARQPRREQVVFFVLPEVAEQAGFRSCQRCCPRNPAPPDPQFDLVLQVCRYIEANVRDPLPLKVLSERINKSPSYLQRTFKQIMGTTPRAFTEAHRLRQLKTLLKQRQSVATALYQAGYGSSSCLYGRAVPHLGMTPLTYQRGRVVSYKERKIMGGK
ncbi:Ada metal-binding domain-containing protein [Chamaesiphon minutus]|nr:Ada metal-binding domain-containing protein [Chamaesiphon minutus]